MNSETKIIESRKRERNKALNLGDAALARRKLRLQREELKNREALHMRTKQAKKEHNAAGIMQRLFRSYIARRAAKKWALQKKEKVNLIYFYNKTYIYTNYIYIILCIFILMCSLYDIGGARTTGGSSCYHAAEDVPRACGT
jgi:hypothetical protein